MKTYKTKEQRIMDAHRKVTEAQMKKMLARTDAEQREAEQLYRMALQRLSDAENS